MSSIKFQRYLTPDPSKFLRGNSSTLFEAIESSPPLALHFAYIIQLFLTAGHTRRFRSAASTHVRVVMAIISMTTNEAYY